MNKFSARIDLTVRVQYMETVPRVRIAFGSHVMWDDLLPDSGTLTFDTPDMPAGTHTLSIKLLNKDESELQRFGQDMMISIDSVRVQRYDHEFAIYSEYEPEYPEPWYTQQCEAGTEPPRVIHSNYIGWPGEWRLPISLPVYRWIHQRTSQGWLI